MAMILTEVDFMHGGGAIERSQGLGMRFASILPAGPRQRPRRIIPVAQSSAIPSAQALTLPLRRALAQRGAIAGLNDYPRLILIAPP